MSEFKKETRYQVFKLKNLTDDQKQRLYDLKMELGPYNDIGECVVVKKDWPNYQETWDSIRAIFEGNYTSRHTLIAQIQMLQQLVKEEAYQAYWEASDNYRADRWAENFDDSVRAEFEKYWEHNGHKSKQLPEPSEYIRQIKAEAINNAVLASGDAGQALRVPAGYYHSELFLLQYAERVAKGE